jgi:integrase
VKLEVTLVNEKLAHARGGEVVLYKRGDSARWQARYKLKDLKWHRVATKHVNLKYAAEVACEAYDRARFLFAENIPVSSKRFDVAANIAIKELEQQIAAKLGKAVYNDYITSIRKYLIPFFGRYNINSIGYEEMQAFGTWRIKEMKRVPAASTITTHISAMNRVFDVAIERGWVVRAQIPKMKNTGAKGSPREAFSQSEYNSLASFMVNWSEQGHTEKTRQMRALLRDYVLVLKNTGMRHGTEALGLRWRDIAFIKRGAEQYLQFTVTGKTGKRTLIATHHTEEYLRRLQLRQPSLAKFTFEDLLKKKVNQPVFKMASGETTKNLAGTFRILMRDSGLDNDRDTKHKRTLYSLRHTYAHFALMKDRMSVYTLAEQMGTSVKMIEQHYGHITPALKAQEIAGKRHVPRVPAADAVAGENTNVAEPIKATKALKKQSQKSSVT